MKIKKLSLIFGVFFLFLLLAPTMLYSVVHTYAGIIATAHDHSKDWIPITSESTVLQDGKYCLTEDVFLSDTLTIAQGATVDLCLNGYQLMISPSADQNCCIYIERDAKLYLKDCHESSESQMYQHAYYVGEDSRFIFNDGTQEWQNAYNTSPAEKQGAIGGGVITSAPNSYATGIYVAFASLTVYSGVIAGNDADVNYGGGINANSSSLTFHGGTVIGNTAIAGGGIHASGSESDITLNFGSTISNNSADNFGGGGAIQGGSLTINGAIIENNQAQYGGGINFNAQTFTLNSGTICGNTATVNGGGINTFNDIFIDQGVLENNTAQQRGGGIYINAFSPFSIDGGTYRKNTASLRGNAIYATSDLEINGGYFDDENTIDSSEKIVIQGGYFSNAPQTSLLAKGYAIQQIDAKFGDSDFLEEFPFAVYQSVSFTLFPKGAIVYDGEPIEEDADFLIEGAPENMRLFFSYKKENASVYTEGLPCNAGTYTVQAAAFKIDEKLLYRAETTLTIDKKTPSYTAPKNLSGTKGQKLSEIALPDGWSWKNDSPTLDGKKTFQAIAVFMPDDPENYASVEIAVSIQLSGSGGCSSAAESSALFLGSSIVLSCAALLCCLRKKMAA